MNRRDMRGKPKYLARWKEYTAEEDTWEGLENLKNTMDLVENFEKKIREEEKIRVQMRKEKGKKESIEFRSKSI